MPPLVLALIDSVLGLALHHQQRASKGLMPDHESASIHVEITGPEHHEPAPGGLAVRVQVTLIPRSEEREVTREQVEFHIDLVEERLLARDLDLAELPLDRSGLARLVGELEAWCYRMLPLEDS